MINVELQIKKNKIDVELEIEEQELDIDLQGSLIGKVYEGTYIVIPKRTDQSLPTRNSLLLDNVQVPQIPYKEITNLQGGKTVIIAND